MQQRKYQQPQRIDMIAFWLRTYQFLLSLHGLGLKHSQSCRAKKLIIITSIIWLTLTNGIVIWSLQFYPLVAKNWNIKKELGLKWAKTLKVLIIIIIIERKGRNPIWFWCFVYYWHGRLNELIYLKKTHHTTGYTAWSWPKF